MKKTTILLGLLLFIFSYISIAAPNTPGDLTEGTPERKTVDTTDKTASAYAGNMTQIIISDNKITDRWQGYYGNVSGRITLDDAYNRTMYDWDLGSVQGEIYASNASISAWTTVHCLNFTSPGTNCPWNNSNLGGTDSTCINLTKLESFLGIGYSARDGVDETFNETIVSLEVGTATLTGCPMVHPYVNETYDTSTWNETILTLNNSADTVIYTAIVNDDAYGYDNTTWDFQMLVGDNGDDSLATSYFFYIELA